MSFEIVTPTKIENPLYENNLELIVEGERENNQESITANVPGPVVTLGVPQCWNLAKLARERGKMLPSEMLLLMKDADFYLVRLACSFKPERHTRVEWAQFTVFLRPQKAGYDAPIAFDMYPLQVYDKIEKDIKVTIAPSLKFANVEGALGEVVTTIACEKLEPVITGFGALQSNPSWEFEYHKNYPLKGSKFTYLIVKKPHKSGAVRILLDIVADVVSEQHGLLSARIAKKDKEYLAQVICAEG